MAVIERPKTGEPASNTRRLSEVRKKAIDHAACGWFAISSDIDETTYFDINGDVALRITASESDVNKESFDGIWIGLGKPETEIGVIVKTHHRDTVKTDPEKLIRKAFLEKLYNLDKPETMDEAFDLVVERTDELLCNGLFEECDRIFEQIDVRRISSSIITILLRSTYMAGPRLPERSLFLERVKHKIVASRGKVDAERMINSLR